ncbi:MAG: restriction endonuclease subunit S [Lachnospiraceae bacterium]|nr:restriction endonuclease subunit S [Lachnospiraceae bacterium]
MNFLEHIVLNPKIKLKKGEVYPFVEMANVSTNNREPDMIENRVYTSGVKFEEYDTVIARIEPCLQNGKKFLAKGIKQGFGSTEYLVFRPMDDMVDAVFLYYFMQTDYIRKSMIGSMTGSTGRQRVNNDIFKTLDIEVPNIEVQRKIAKILSAYDDLIENNKKQIKLLEEMAQCLYKEWFLDLHFPGYEEVEIVDGVPEGWSRKKISDFGEIITGKTPSTSRQEYYGGNIPFVKIPDMHNGVYPIITEATLTIEGANTQKSKFIPRNSILVSCIATVGLVNIAVESCQTNQQINSIVLENLEDLYYVYSTMKRLKALLQGVGSNGATMTNVNKTKFGNLEVLYPDNSLRKAYYDFCEPIFRKIYDLSISSTKLVQARDGLCSKCMSGELEV